MPQFSLIHASKGRPYQAAAAAKSWLTTAKNRSDIEYILSIDVDDIQANKEAYSNIHADTLLCYDNKSAIEAFNRAAKVAKGRILIVISDDFNQAPFHWDEYLSKQLSDKSDFVVKTDDGAQPWIITLPIMDNVYYKRFGYIYNPIYKHMFCDTEMTHVADLLGKKIKLPIRFIHNHYTTGRTQKDYINEKNDSTWTQGEAEYLKGVMCNFGLPANQIIGVLQCDEGHLKWLETKGINFEIVTNA